MLKQHKGKAIISSLLTLLPMVAGLLLWNRLPDNMVSHWGADGNADGSMGKAFCVFGMPLILLAVHWLCLLITARDPGNRNQNHKAMGLVFWIIPMVSLTTSGFLYAYAMGQEWDVGYCIVFLMAVMFIFMGNYMPKTSQNHTFGIKTVWAIRDEENWNRTHRMGGKLWVAGGFALLCAMLLPEEIMIWIMLLDIAVMAAVPAFYSYWIYRKKKQSGTLPVYNSSWGRKTKIAAWIGSILGVLILVGCVVLMFTGDVQVWYNDNSLVLDSQYYNSITVRYSEIENVEYTEDFVPGTRVNGFGSPRLSMGVFKNDTYGRYTLYAYTGCDAHVILTVRGEKLAIGFRTAEETQELYQTILQEMGSK